MTIAIITSGSFPYGEASTNRLITYAEGMIELGHDVRVLVINPLKQQSSKSNQISGQFNGIKFKYTSLTTKWPKSILSKLSIQIKGVYNGLRELSLLNKTKIIDALIVPEYYPLKVFPFILFTKINKITILHEYNEFPFLNQEDTLLKRLRLKIYLRWIVPKYDGLFLITKALLNYYKPYINKRRLATVVPIMVEPDRFVSCTKASDYKFQYIAYCGSMYTNKDGLLILIEAFSLVVKQYQNLHLILIGDNSNKEKFNYIVEKINSLKLSNKIHFTGRVSRDEMPGLLCNARLLALSRPDNIQSKGGFPTKLGEYLATGKPVVVTAVGEIPEYLVDGENSFVAEPDDHVSFSEKINEALKDYDRASTIGKNGQELAFGVFNYKVQAQKMLNFIDETDL